MNSLSQATSITPKVKNYLRMQNVFTLLGFMAPIAMIFYLMNFFPLPFSWEVIELIIYFSYFALPLVFILTLLFNSEIKSGADIKLLGWTFKITLYAVLLFYFFTFIYSIVAEKELAGYYYYYFFTVLNVAYFGMYLICLFFLVLAIKANDLLINSLKK